MTTNNANSNSTNSKRRVPVAQAEQPKVTAANTFWKRKSKYYGGGAKRLLDNAEKLMQEAYTYFTWCDKNPLIRYELMKQGGRAVLVEVPLGRPYTMSGLCVYLGVSGSYFRSAKGHIRNKIEEGKAKQNEIEVLEAIEVIEAITQTQNVEGAAVGKFAANLVARLHNIADNVNQNTAGDSVIRITVRDDETAENLSKLTGSL